MGTRLLLSALITLQPPRFRARYGDAIRAFYSDRIREASGGLPAQLAMWGRMMADAVTTAAIEWGRLLAERPRTPSPRRRDTRMKTLLYDARHAMRAFARRPGFTAVIIGTIALGVGANAAIFSVVNGVLLRPLAFPEPDRVVLFGHHAPQWLTSDPNFVDYQRDVTSLQSLAAYTQAFATLTGDGEPERIRIARVSPEFFPTLGVNPVRGRYFATEEHTGNGTGAVMLSNAFWRRRFGGDDTIVGRTIVVNGIGRTVVGIMPRHFNFPEARTDIWTPMPRFNHDSLGHRANNYLFMVGRIKPTATIGQLRSEASVVAARIMRDNAAFFDPAQPLRPDIEEVEQRLVKHARPYLFALLGTVGFVLLIACANVANLLLANAEGRRRELAVRSALGAGRGRLVAQMLTENACVALVGALVGLLAAWSVVRMITAMGAGFIPRLDEVVVDWRVAMFALALAVCTAMLISILPVLRVASDRTFSALRTAGKAHASAGARSARRAIVVAEVALAVVALCGAGMLLRSLRNLESADVGFDSANVLTARVSIAARDYHNERTAQFYANVLEQVQAIPGVQVAGAAGWLPVVDAGGQWGITPEGRAYGPGLSSGNQPMAVPQQVTHGYFEASGVAIQEGREFTAADGGGAPLVAIVSESMAEAYWPGEPVIGKRFRVGGISDFPLATIVGVAEDILARGFADRPEPTMYFPLAQTGRSTYFMPRAMALVVRTTENPHRFAAAVKAAVHSLDPSAPVSEIRTMEEVIGTSVATRRLGTALLTMFAILALLLAGIGTYAVIAHGVAQRTYEIGVRMALGAERQSVFRLVMVDGMQMCAAGVAIGLALALVIARAIGSMLVEVPRVDVVSLGASAAVLLVAALLATAIPARRALKVSPTEALRGG